MVEVLTTKRNMIEYTLSLIESDNDGENEPVTIIACIITQGGVVVAADSQAGTHRGVRVKRSDYTKIYNLGAEDSEVQAVIAGAGAMAFINKAVNDLREKWLHKRFSSVR